MKRLEVRQVWWIDAVGNDGWDDQTEYAKETLAACESVGYVLKETAAFVVLVQSVSDDVAHNSITIPKFAITKMATLRKAVL